LTCASAGRIAAHRPAATSEEMGNKSFKRVVANPALPCTTMRCLLVKRWGDRICANFAQHGPA